MDKSFQNKVSEIIKAFNENDCKVWHIGTDFVKTWERFHRDLLYKGFDFSNFDFTTFEIFCLSHEKEKNKYIFQINNIEIRPHTKISEGWSMAGIRQFLQVGEALGFFVINFESLSKIKTNESCFGHLTIEFLEVLEKDFINDFVYYVTKAINRAVFTGSKHIKNFGFTIFLCFLLKNSVVFKSEIPITKISNRSQKGKKFNKTLLFGTNEYLEYIEDVCDKKKTYTTIIKLMNAKYEIEIFVEALYKLIEKNEIFYETYEEKNQDSEFQDLIKSYFNSIDILRGDLRNKIIEARVKDAKKYNDLDNAFPLEWFIEDCEAAHIFDIWRIKNKIQKIIINKSNDENWKEKVDQLVKDSNNPNNGILLLKQWHHYFDRNLLSFDLSGNLIILPNPESMERLIPINPNNDIQKVKIKDCVLSEEMKKYLKNRF